MNRLAIMLAIGVLAGCTSMESRMTPWVGQPADEFIAANRYYYAGPDVQPNGETIHRFTMIYSTTIGGGEYSNPMTVTTNCQYWATANYAGTITDIDWNDSC